MPRGVRTPLDGLLLSRSRFRPLRSPPAGRCYFESALARRAVTDVHKDDTLNDTALAQVAQQQAASRGNADFQVPFAADCQHRRPDARSRYMGIS